jgi:cyclase
VKGTSFTNLRDAGSPVELSSFYYTEGADELVFLDIGATPEQRNTMVEIVEQVAKQVFIPLTVGGGLRSIENMRRMLEAGADKVSVNTAAVNNPSIIKEGANKFGSQCIVLAIDAMQDSQSQTPRWLVCTHGGRKPTNIDAVEWAKIGVEMGAGEILLTSWDADGQKAGYDLQLTRTISEAVPVPVIASGGAGTLEHLYEALVEGKADAVLAASIFHYRTYSIRQVKEYLANRGIAVRLDQGE